MGVLGGSSKGRSMGLDWNDRGTPALEGLFVFGFRTRWLYCGGVGWVAEKLTGIGRPAPNPGQSLQRYMVEGKEASVIDSC